MRVKCQIEAGPFSGSDCSIQALWKAHSKINLKRILSHYHHHHYYYYCYYYYMVHILDLLLERFDKIRHTVKYQCYLFKLQHIRLKFH